MPKDVNFLEYLNTHDERVITVERDRLLANSRYEVIPLKGVVNHLAQCSSNHPVTVTCSPRMGLTHTLEVSRQLSSKGHQVVPHLAAKLVEGREHLVEIVELIRAIGVDDVFIVGGDAATPVGPYRSAGELLQALATLDHGLKNIGVGAYPEGHPHVADGALLEALQDKQQHATYMSTQLCFDPAAIDGWINQVSKQGITLPLYIGVPGAVKIGKLIEIALRVGVGDSLRYLKSQRSLAKTMLLNGAYLPDDLLQAASQLALYSELPIKGLHIFTFNQMAQTYRWQRDNLGENASLADTCLACSS